MRKSSKRSLIFVCIVAAVLGGLALFFRPVQMTAPGVGLEEAVASDPADKPLSLLIWYPTEQGQPGKIRAGQLPLIVVSHGTGGSYASHADTNIALAKAGFVVVAVTHTGDNYRDLSYVGRAKYLTERPRHVSLVIDYMLANWASRSHLDPARIGMLGHSAGGFTALVLAGGTPDLSRTIAHCRSQPKAWDCLYWRKQGTDLSKLSGQGQQAWTHDPRIKAEVIAAPAIGYGFGPDRLSSVQIPIQLWGAGHDTIVDDSAQVIDGLLSGNKEFHPVANAGHFSFLAPCNWPMAVMITVMSWFGTDRICDDPAGFDRARFHGEFNRDVTEFFVKYLESARP